MLIFKYFYQAFKLIWSTDKVIASVFSFLTVFAAIVPALIAVVSKWVVDEVVLLTESGVESWDTLGEYLLTEASLVLILALCQRGLSLCEDLLRALLSQRTNEIILDKALTLSLGQFEDSEIYDKMTQARRKASQAPLSLVRKLFGLIQNSISLLSYAGILWALSPWVVLAIVLAGLPLFAVEAYFSESAFRLFKFQTPETRIRMYLEIIMAREDYAKEVKLFGLGPFFMNRYREIFHRLFQEDKKLSYQRAFWAGLLGALSVAVLYVCYGYTIWRTVLDPVVTIGSMTMFFMVLKQGQSTTSAALASIGGMYEDYLYLSNLKEFLDLPLENQNVGGVQEGLEPNDGIRFESVYFCYPGSETPVFEDFNLHIPRGTKVALVGENGSGKTTLIKLLTGLYQPSAGRILFQGVDIKAWNTEALREHYSVIFQDFSRYQLSVGENIGVGYLPAIEDEAAWKEAAVQGLADEWIQKLPEGYHTQLGRWFIKGQELSGGQWQRIALSRSFIRKNAEVVILDEPTSAMDPESEQAIFEHVQELSDEKIVVVISHRFSTVRSADRILVMDSGVITEDGSHKELMELNGRYAELFELQAAAYRD